MKVISYVTAEYKKYGERLQDNLRDLGLPHHIEFLRSWDDKKGHKIYKPFFLEWMFAQFPDDVLMLVDGDSFFLNAPPKQVWNIKTDMGLVEGKQNRNFEYWLSDACHIHRPTQGTKEFIRIWKSLCREKDFIRGNNHPRFMAAYYLSRRMTTWEFIDLKGSFVRNYGKKEMIY